MRLIFLHQVPSAKNPAPRRQGFTLLELIIYIGAGTMMILLLTALFIAFSQSWMRSRARARVEENLRFAIQAIQESVASAEEILVPASGGADTLTLALPPSSGDNQAYYGWAWSGNEDSSDGTIGAWPTTTALPDPRARHASVLLNGYVYVLGGIDASNQDNKTQSTIYFSKPDFVTGNIPASGPGSWQTNSVSLPAPRARAAAVTLNGYIYHMGGTDTSGDSTATVYFTKPNTDGTISSWASTTSLPSDRSSLTAVTANGYLYVVGGSGSATVYYAKPNVDGTIPAWTLTTALPEGRFRHASVVANNYIYAIGGEFASIIQSTVYYAPLNSDGTVGSWSSTTPIYIPLSRLTAVTSFGYLYMIGGRDSSDVERSGVYSAKFNQNGTLGSWTAITSLPQARGRHSSVVANGYIYVLAGRASGTTYDTVYVSKLNTTFDIGWISLNCKKPDGTDNTDPFDCTQDKLLTASTQFDNYGVKRSAGVLAGYAVNCPDAASASDKPCYPSSFNCKNSSDSNLCGVSDYRVTVDGNGVYHGFAWGGDVIGWISFNCDNTSSCGTVDYKVTETKSTSGAELFGWAWSENVGWISFNCKDREAVNPGVCTTAPYSVTTTLAGTTRTFAVDSSSHITRQDASAVAVPLTASTVEIEKCAGWTNYFQHFANPPDPRAGVRMCVKASYSGVASFLFPYSAEQQQSVQVRSR